ncbi:MAG: carbonic anhydrase [Halodesulfurarchaeum sp.]
MPDTTLATLLERNRRHTDTLETGAFTEVQGGQKPAAVSVSCADSRVSQEGMFDVSEPGWLFTPSTIGNQVWDRHDGERVVDGSVLYPLVETGTEVAVVVGHTGCGAITAALEAVEGGDTEYPPGIEKWVEALSPVIEAGLADERVDPTRDASLVDQLVEYNVDRQVQFLIERGEVPESVSVFGFVYDFQGVYGSIPGRTYLINVDGQTDPATLRERVPDEAEGQVRRLL